LPTDRPIGIFSTTSSPLTWNAGRAAPGDPLFGAPPRAGAQPADPTPGRRGAMTANSIGARKFDLDTPILCIDLDILEDNIATMAGFMQGRGKGWRPHAKCHKTPAIAWKQRAAGALGVTCAKVSEAEVMAASGIRDILVANMIVGVPKWERVAALCRQADPIIACDDLAQVEPLAAVCRRHGVTCRMLIEVDLGMERVGVCPGAEPVRLAAGALCKRSAAACAAARGPLCQRA